MALSIPRVPVNIYEDYVSCDNDFGGANSSMGSVFCTNGMMPEFQIRWPNHSHSFLAKLHFSSFSAIISLSILFKIFSTRTICSISEPRFDTTD